MLKDVRFRKIVILMIIVFGLICFFPILFTLKTTWGASFLQTGPIGDTIGGIMSPFIAIIAAFLTFLAFWVQYKFNEDQIKRLDDQGDAIIRQENSLKYERFENRFFELLKIHRDNVQEFEISRFDVNNSLTGRRVFYEMVEELRFTFKLAEFTYNRLVWTNELEAGSFSDKEVFRMAYVVFFDGINQSEEYSFINRSEEKFEVLGSKYKILLKKYLEELREIKRTFINRNGSLFVRDVKVLNETLKNGQIGSVIKHVEIAYPKIKYVPFSGHNSRLGHYYRHLYQMVNYVVSSDNKIVKDKYSFIKIIRAQLSNFEQVLLYFNSLSFFGKAWLSENYFTDWRIIKNMPLYLVDFGPNPKELLGEFNFKGERIFEIDEVLDEKVNS